MTGSSNQDQTLTNELSYFDESNLLSSTVITIENKTLKEKLKTSLAHGSIISNNDSDDDKSDTDIINVLSYAVRIKEIADRIEDAHRLNNGG